MEESTHTAESAPNNEVRYWMYVVLLVAGAAAVGIAVAARQAPALRLEIHKAILTLITGGLIGGILKMLLDDVIASRKRWEDAAGFVTNVLSDLKAVYDRVERARLLISAHRSAKTYGDELRDLIDSRVKLLNVIRALQKRADGLHEDVRRALVADVRSMEGYIAALTGEFREKYKEISNAQSIYEASIRRGLKRVEEGAEFPDVQNEPWTTIKKLPAASEFLSDDPHRYMSEFVTPLDNASAILRAELARVLRRKRPSTNSLHGLPFARQ